MSTLTTTEFGAASALLNVLRQTGPVVGGAVIGLLIQVLATTTTSTNPLGLSGSIVAVVLSVPLALFVLGLGLSRFLLGADANHDH